jgi:hypothetical protein
MPEVKMILRPYAVLLFACVAAVFSGGCTSVNVSGFHDAWVSPDVDYVGAHMAAQGTIRQYQYEKNGKRYYSVAYYPPKNEPSRKALLAYHGGAWRFDKRCLSVRTLPTPGKALHIPIGADDDPHVFFLYPDGPGGIVNRAFDYALASLPISTRKHGLQDIQFFGTDQQQLKQIVEGALNHIQKMHNKELKATGVPAP